MSYAAPVFALDIAPSYIGDFYRMVQSIPHRLRRAAAHKYATNYRKESKHYYAIRAAERSLTPVLQRIEEQPRGGRIFSDDLVKKIARNRAGECLLRKSGLEDRDAFIACSVACHLEGIAPPDVEKYSLASAVARLCCERWWIRQLRKHHARGYEATARDLNVVCSKRQIYCSDSAVQRVKIRKSETVSVLEELEAVCEDTGEVFRLAELAGHALANPNIRRGELMTRIRGFEEYAIGQGDVADFVTLSCPSRFHATVDKGGRENPKYDGSTPRDAQGYLCELWARIRAALKRREVNIYGFRVAEPHHDGTPHWHCLLFVNPADLAVYRDVVRRHALRESPGERGAQQHRCKFVTIDPKRGTAAGYIAKYIAKSIDGFGIDHDLFGKDAKASAARVIAWASTWGIRQFQQFGGPRVGVWRELRRQRETVEGAPDEFEAARVAADTGDWATFCRVGQSVGLLKDQQESLGMYGDALAPRVVGVITGLFEVITRPFKWFIQPASGGPWTRVNNCTEVHSERETCRTRRAVGATGIGSTPQSSIGVRPEDRPPLD